MNNHDYKQSGDDTSTKILLPAKDIEDTQDNKESISSSSNKGGSGGDEAALKPAAAEVTFLITSASEAEEKDGCRSGTTEAREDDGGNTSPEEVKLNSEVRKFHQVIMKNQPEVANMVTVRDRRDQWL